VNREAGETRTWEQWVIVSCEDYTSAWGCEPWMVIGCPTVGACHGLEASAAGGLDFYRIDGLPGFICSFNIECENSAAVVGTANHVDDAGCSRWEDLFVCSG